MANLTLINEKTELFFEEFRQELKQLNEKKMYVKTNEKDMIKLRDQAKELLLDYESMGKEIIAKDMTGIHYFLSNFVLDDRSEIGLTYEWTARL